MAAKKTTVIAEMINDNLDIRYDEFINEINIKSDFAKEEVMIEHGRMTDNKAILIQTFLERKYDLALTNSKVNEAIAMASTQNTYSSAYDWIESKEWDGKPRLWTIATNVFGNSDEHVNQALGIWIVNLVAGAYSVATGKFQYSLDIIGQQGTGKTTFLKRLGQEYYTDQFMSYTSKDSFEVMLKNLLINDDEMQVTEISREKAFKKFVSTSEFTYRPAYGRNPLMKSRHFVIARTTNDYEYLTDMGGNRRIIPLIVNKKSIKTPAFDLPDSWYENVLGEAKAYYIKKEADIDLINKVMINNDFESINSNLNVNSEVDDAIMHVKDTEFVGQDKISVTQFNSNVELYLYSNQIDTDSRSLKRNIMTIMTREGYVKKLVKIAGKPVRSYVKD
jgi:predicted P-loop ATPase